MTLANLSGQSQTYSWQTTWPSSFAGPTTPAIQIINLAGSGSAGAFQIVQPNVASFAPVSRQTTGGSFNKLTDWPLIGTTDLTYDKPTNTPVSAVTWSSGVTEKRAKSWMMMTGLTNGTVSDLVTIAKSWLQPPAITVLSGNYSTIGFNAGDKAYALTCTAPGSPTVMSVRLDGSSSSPICNPAFVITSWGKKDCSLKVNGVTFDHGPLFRYGYRKTATVSDLIIWVQFQSAQPITFEVTPL